MTLPTASNFATFTSLHGRKARPKRCSSPGQIGRGLLLADFSCTSQTSLVEFRHRLGGKLNPHPNQNQLVRSQQSGTPWVLLPHRTPDNRLATCSAEAMLTIGSRTVPALSSLTTGDLDERSEIRPPMGFMLQDKTNAFRCRHRASKDTKAAVRTGEIMFDPKPITPTQYTRLRRERLARFGREVCHLNQYQPYAGPVAIAETGMVFPSVRAAVAWFRRKHERYNAGRLQEALQFGRPLFGVHWMTRDEVPTMAEVEA